MASEGDLRAAGTWLAEHGLSDVRPTPHLAARLAVRRRARLVDQILLAGLLVGAALTQVLYPLGADLRPLLLLAGMVIALLVLQALLDRWVRRVDQRVAAALPRRTSHLAQPDWRALLGRPHAAFTVAMFGGAALLATSALTVQETAVRYAALVLLVGVAGSALGVALQLRDLLARPIVAEDQAALTADVIMRIEDARTIVIPSVPWSLPVVVLFAVAPNWWRVASLALIVVGVIVLAVISKRTPASAVIARQVMAAR